jgi:hypothetical protein
MVKFQLIKVVSLATVLQLESLSAPRRQEEVIHAVVECWQNATATRA